MRTTITLLAACLLGTAWAQQYTTPVPILKQINRHNEDGSYSYGYEAADGSFKIETKYPTGEVYGKYGYVDDTGKVREVEYGASRRGFEPAGSDINVPPPTLTNNARDNTLNGQEDDGQYREDPSVYYKNPQQYNGRHTNQYRQPAYNPPQPAYNPPQPAYNPPQPAYRPQPQYNPVPAPQYNPAPQPQYNPAPQPQYNPAPQPQYNPVPQPQYQPQYQPQQQYRPVTQQAFQSYLNPSQFSTHPAVKNIDYFSGSYSIDYTGKKK